MPSRTLLFFALPLLTLASTGAAQSAYHIAQSYPLGESGGWDYVIPDPATRRVFIARQDRVMVVDEDTGTLLTEIKDIHGAHGTAVAGNTGHIFLTSGNDQSVVMIDAKNYAFLKRITAAEDADAIVYDPASTRVFSLNGDANNTTVIDAKSGNVIKNLPLGGKPEYGAMDGTGKLFVNLEDKNEIVEIDTAKAEVSRRWSTGECAQPVAMAIDTKNHRLFSGCRSGVLAISDSTKGAVITTVPIGKGVDGAGYDPATTTVFTSNGDGTLTVIHQQSPDQYQVVETVTTPIGSRNMAVDLKTHRLLVPSAKFGPPAKNGRRGPVLPNSFTLLVLEAQSNTRP